ncbi:molybdenum cofactor biosynthesis protein MoaE [uncultured Pontibacter sp.]|uniref:molybdenum cofactor biosynthesis protein MoaE n=1 Tax=uncultured Pontibacter sp. TaxID=453356 RepID=UPI00260C36AA|nr:molybdenum cofactor biosynthesis protein MoaE [uncultured Pontibacter sp.]
MIDIVNEIDLNVAYKHLRDPGSGAISLFLGSVRNATKGEEVYKLEYEAYREMAMSEMQKIAAEATTKYKLQKTLIIHAVGEKQVGDLVVVIGASAPHRKDAMEATKYMIDTLKQTVPIWKKEFFENKQVWVSENP